MNNNLDWKNQEYFKILEEDKKHHINWDEDSFCYENYNPKGLSGMGDCTYQLIRKLRKELSDKEIIAEIYEDLCAHALPFPDEGSIKRILKKVLNMKYVKLPEPISPEDVLDYDFETNSPFVILRLGPVQFEYFDLCEKVFRGCHLINKNQEIRGYLVPKEII